MDWHQIPDDYSVTVHQFTKTAYRDQYPAIDPTSPALSQKDKVIIITGASKGIGRKVGGPFCAANGGLLLI